MDTYLADLGRKPGLKDWQFRQAVDAIRMLFVLAGVNWLERVDWEHWRASARRLGPEHPTVARDYQPIPGGPRQPAGEPATFEAIRQAHGGLLDQVATAARVRGLAIRTEQTYLRWIMRYIGYLGNLDPAEKGAEAAAGFLEHRKRGRVFTESGVAKAGSRESGVGS